MTYRATGLAVVANERAEPAAVLLSHLQSISKSTRQLISIKLAECEVMAGQDQFLLCFEEGEAVSVAALADRLSVRASTVSKMTDILQRRGWVERQADEHDARKVRVRLTETGCQVRDTVRAVEARLGAELLSVIGADATIVPVLAKLDAVLTKRLSRYR